MYFKDECHKERFKIMVEELGYPEGRELVFAAYLFSGIDKLFNRRHEILKKDSYGDYRFYSGLDNEDVYYSKTERKIVRLACDIWCNNDSPDRGVGLVSMLAHFDTGNRTMIAWLVLNYWSDFGELVNKVMNE